MAFDRNPHYGKDQSFVSGAGRTLDLLWDTTNGEVSAFPKSYLENLRHDFADGSVSMLELIDRVDLGTGATYEDYCEVVDALMKVDPSEWPDTDSVVSVPAGHLLHEIEPETDFSEFWTELEDSLYEFAEDIEEEAVVDQTPQGMVVEEGVAEQQTDPDPLSEKMELFFKKVIASVYLDGVTSVTDAQGNPPTEANNYLMAEDGKSFSGIFYDSPANEKGKQFPFTITEGATGKWNINY